MRGVHEYVLPLYREQEASGKRGKAHGVKHQYGVALNAAQRAEALAREHNLSEDEREHLVNLAWITGITHDLIRNPSEEKKGAKTNLLTTDGFVTALQIVGGRKPGQSRRVSRKAALKAALVSLPKGDLARVGRAIVNNEKPGEQVAKKI